MDKKTQNPSLKPFVKWVGGKSRSLNQLLPLIPDKISTYVEPFVGGGAMFYAVNFKRAIINDVNYDLINTYQVIKDNVDELEFFLKTLIYDKQTFLNIRAMDRSPEYPKLPRVERAGRLIYLLKTCYNGLYRVSSKGFFNTPFGNYKNPTICDSQTLEACSRYLNDHDVRIENKDFYDLLDIIPEDAFVYLDPPYVPLSKTASFTAYHKDDFPIESHYRLNDFVHDLHNRGIRFMLSNSDCDLTREIFRDFKITTISARRSINSDTSKRAAISELVITNYNTQTFELIKI
ncbi:MAG: DNA adenine methylase [Succinivibrio sp.]